MAFLYEKAKSLPEALALFAANSGRMPLLAGGTDLIVQWRTGVIDPPGFIDMGGIEELMCIAELGDAIEIGALATHAEIAASAIVRRRVPVLAEACATIGASQIQNRGTIGGNIMNASPAGDTLPVIMAFDAELKVQDLKGERWIEAQKFYTGYRKTSLAPGEILTAVRIPWMAKDEKARFYKVGTRRAQAISKVVMCCRALIDHGGIGEIAIAIGSVAPTVVRAPGTEALLRGRVVNEALVQQARHSIMDEVTPIDDVRSTADYRRFVCGNLLARFLREAVAKR